jgi:hypothetical protein
MKIFNIYQADFLIRNGCRIVSCGLQGKVFIEFEANEIFDNYMRIWKTRRH